MGSQSVGNRKAMEENSMTLFGDTPKWHLHGPLLPWQGHSLHGSLLIDTDSAHGLPMVLRWPSNDLSLNEHFLNELRRVQDVGTANPRKGRGGRPEPPDHNVPLGGSFVYGVKHITSSGTPISA